MSFPKFNYSLFLKSFKFSPCFWNIICFLFSYCICTSWYGPCSSLMAIVSKFLLLLLCVPVFWVAWFLQCFESSSFQSFTLTTTGPWPSTTQDSFISLHLALSVLNFKLVLSQYRFIYSLGYITSLINSHDTLHSCVIFFSSPSGPT